MTDRSSEAVEHVTRRIRGRSQESFVRRLSEVSFPAAMRGYDRAAVDSYVEEVTRIVAELEARQSSEAVIKKALDEVGEHTSAILQKAHDSAEEIARRSRVQADDRLQRAEREAEEVQRQIDDWLRQSQHDTEALLAERRRILDEMRRLAEELLGVADDSLERLEELEARVTPEPAAEEAAAEGVQPEEPGSEPAEGEAAAEADPEPTAELDSTPPGEPEAREPAAERERPA
jgi:cell division initiation protein